MSVPIICGVRIAHRQGRKRVARPAADIEDPRHRLQLDQVQPLQHPAIDLAEQEVGVPASARADR